MNIKTKFIIVIYKRGDVHDILLDKFPGNLDHTFTIIKEKIVVLIWGNEPYYTEFVKKLENYKSENLFYDINFEMEGGNIKTLVDNYLFGDLK